MVPRRVLIIGRFDTPTHYTAAYFRTHADHVVLLKTSMQIHPQLFMVELSESRNGSAFSVVKRIPHILRLYSARRPVRLLQFFMNYCFVGFYTVWYMLTHGGYGLVIGIGPLNGALAVLYRLRNWSVKTVYYAEDKVSSLTPDVLSRLTYVFDAIARRISDAVWVMSTVYLKELLSDGNGKYAYVPIPAKRFGNALRMPDKPYRIVFLGSIAREHGYDLLYNVVKRLVRNGVRVKLVIIGSGRNASEFSRQVKQDGMSSVIENHGFISNHEKIMRIISRCHIGVCLYNPEEYRNLAYGQSAKVTNYAACGLPVIMTGSPSNMPSLVPLLKKFGFGLYVRFDERSVYAAMKRLLTERPLYARMRKNTQRLREYFEEETWYTQAVSRV